MLIICISSIMNRSHLTIRGNSANPLGLSWSGTFSFSSFQVVIKKIRPNKCSLEYFHEARKDHQMRNLSSDSNPSYNGFLRLAFWVDKPLIALSLEENKTSKIEEQIKSTKVFTSYHTDMNCYSQKYIQLKYRTS